jgi:hypothetical protein
MYEKIVEELRKHITELNDVKVMFNDDLADEVGPHAAINLETVAASFWFGVGLLKEGICLPSKPFNEWNSDFSVIKEMLLKEFGYCDEMLLVMFTILHELGHCIEAFKDRKSYAKEAAVQRELLARAQAFGATKEEMTVLYRRMNQEKQADQFAISKLKLILGGN